jgi:hypothetical protein
MAKVEGVAVSVVEAAVAAASGQGEISAAQGKCTRRHALSADRNAKFRSSLQKASLFSARNAIEREKRLSRPLLTKCSF